jgi:branched-chain amino acid transport system substrate-binding protein
VAVILPLSGDAANIGIALQNGAQLAEESLAPAVRSRIALHFEDDRLDPKETISAYNKLAGEHRLAAAITASSGTSSALAPITEQHGVPLIAIASDPQIIAGRRHSVLLWVTPAAECAAIIPELKRRGYKSLARIASQQVGAIAISAEFDLQSDGAFQISPDEQFPLDVKDFRSFIARLHSRTDLDGILVTLLPGQLSAFAVQVRQAGIQVPLIGWEMFEDIGEVKAANGALLGNWYVNSDDVDGDFLKRYSARFPGAPSYAAANAYDAVMLIARSLEQHSTLDTVLHTVRNFHGAIGTYSASGHSTFTIPAALKEVTAEGFKKFGDGAAKK